MFGFLCQVENDPAADSERRRPELNRIGSEMPELLDQMLPWGT